MVTGVPDDHAGASEPEVPDKAGVPAGPARPEAGDPAPPRAADGGGAEAGAPGSAAGGRPVDPARLSDVDLATAVIEGRATVDATTARWVLLVGEFDRRSLWLADGAVSAAAWLRRECRINAPTSTHLLTVARALRDLPATRDAFTTGTISFEHVRAIAPSLGGGRVDLARRADPIFARAAAWMTPRQVARVVSTWTDIADA
ncbi:MULTISPECIES: DUF222 domain-containing protein [unclassified Pseudofrankia]|uniref:DUF222 domain-containing protein n=1 Tax=unclassified Pseudofrankia TaxID=2994372 RepID=UPI0009F35359|nr:MULTISPECIES: DUF222 domain-containing protein [unclassified Pseudofrankia]MDT3443048.1 DUF222 domain-containing protein [Pseudofrankia sp. BMG5.37]